LAAFIFTPSFGFAQGIPGDALSAQARSASGRWNVK
jgi:hypothetical protein